MRILVNEKLLSKYRRFLRRMLDLGEKEAADHGFLGLFHPIIK